MFKMVFLVHRRPEMDSEDFHRYWSETHAPIAAKLPGLRKYVQNHASGKEDGGDTYDGFAEMWWDSKEAFEQSLASPEGEKAIEDAAKFIDVDRMQSFSVDEVTVV